VRFVQTRVGVPVDRSGTPTRRRCGGERSWGGASDAERLRASARRTTPR
jgi:hypothetical protein